MASNANTEYEQLVQEIYQAINRQHEATTVEVEHDKQLLGRSGCRHQIDVYWKFAMMGVTHQVAVECKNYSGRNNVEIGRLRDFFGVLYDVGNIGGVFATTIGYQSGAKRFADYHKISLLEMRLPTDKDWAGRIWDFENEMVLVQNQVTQWQVKYDRPWIAQNTSHNENSALTLGGYADSIKVYDAQRSEITNFKRMEDELPFKYEEAVGLTNEYNFDEAY